AIPPRVRYRSALMTPSILESLGGGGNTKAAPPGAAPSVLRGFVRARDDGGRPYGCGHHHIQLARDRNTIAERILPDRSGPVNGSALHAAGRQPFDHGALEVEVADATIEPAAREEDCDAASRRCRHPHLRIA